MVHARTAGIRAWPVRRRKHQGLRDEVHRPTLIAGTAGVTYFGFIEGGWRLVPVIYSVLLIVLAVATWIIAPRNDRMPGASKPSGEMLAPLRHVRVWRFSLYYVAVFGAYVALSA